MVDGVVVPRSRIRLPFGAHGVATALLHELAEVHASFAKQTAADFAVVEQLRDALCHLDLREFEPTLRTVHVRNGDDVRELRDLPADSFVAAPLTL